MQKIKIITTCFIRTDGQVEGTSEKITEVVGAYRLPEDVFEAVHEVMNEDVGELLSCLRCL